MRMSEMVGRTDRQSWGLFGACRYPKHESKGRNRDRQAEFGRKQCLMVPAGVFPSEPGMMEMADQVGHDVERGQP